MFIAQEEPTIKMFRTAYYLAKSNRPYSDHEELIKLQQLNGMNLGSILYSRYTATNIITHLASEIKLELTSRIISLQPKFSILIDESTSLSNKTTLIIYLQALLEGEHPERFLTLSN